MALTKTYHLLETTVGARCATQYYPNVQAVTRYEVEQTYHCESAILLTATSVRDDQTFTLLRRD